MFDSTGSVRSAIFFSMTSALFAAGCTSPAVPPSPGDNAPLVLHTRSRDASNRSTVKRVEWDPRRTAVVLVDLWDDHWCKGAAARVGELTRPVSAFLSAARSRGLFVIHAPSTTVRPYDGTPARERARKAPFHAPPVPLATAQRWGTAWCWPDSGREGELPIDDSDMGCDCATKCTIREAWTRQHPAVEIRPEDAVTDDGQEVFNLLEERGIQNVLILGVHLNMCVLGRPFAIRQLVGLGKNVVLVRDLTDTMYNSRMKPFVSHFAGTDLVVEHVERHWCPSVVSTDLVGGAPFRFAGDERPR